MVGVSAALHLQKRGRSVVLVDRRGAAEETSYGNAGLIQREGVVPYSFPHDIRLLWRYAFNMLPEANLHWRDLPSQAHWLYRYWRWSTPQQIAESARAARPLVERCIIEHRELMEGAGVTGMIRETGYLKLFRTDEKLAQALKEKESDREIYGIHFEHLDPAAVSVREPELMGNFAGALLMTDPVSIADPSALGKAYADLFIQRGGKFITADARTLSQTDSGWQVQTVDGPVTAKDAVIALGPWAPDVLRPLGIRFPFGVKRGYHVHFRPRGNAVLNAPVLDTENGYVLAPMSQGIRLTTGAEFANRDSPVTPVQLDRVEPVARQFFPLADRVEAKPWMGARPCLPDMLPAIGPVPGKRGLWTDFGHHHLGFTLGPVTGRLLAELVTGEAPFTDPWPYRIERFA